VVLVDGVDGEYGVLADEGMAVLLRVISLVPVVRNFQLTRHDRTVGMRGSSNSGSRIFCRYLRVAPRMYSLGCCYVVSQRPRVRTSISIPGLFLSRRYTDELTTPDTPESPKYSPDKNHLVLQLPIVVELGADPSSSAKGRQSLIRGATHSQ
jgi:hypothetical protein